MFTDPKNVPEKFVEDVKNAVAKINEAIRPDIGDDPSIKDILEAIAMGQSALCSAILYNVRILAESGFIPRDLEPSLVNLAYAYAKGVKQAMDAQLTLDAEAARAERAGKDSSSSKTVH